MTSTDLYLRIDAAGRSQPFRIVNGLYRLDVGEPFVSHRDAIDFCNRPATPGADEPDPAGVWGTASGDGERRPLGSPDLPPDSATPSRRSRTATG